MRILLAGFLLAMIGSLPAIACAPGNPRQNDYMRRDNNRCEGIQSRTVVSGSLELISFTTNTTSGLGRTLQIRVPRLPRSQPEVVLRSISARYQLDQIAFGSNSDYYSFDLPTTVLNRANIDLEELRATANAGTQVVYLPVILQQPSNGYEFVFYSNNSVRFVEAGIRPLRGGNALVSWGAQTARQGEKAFEWRPSRSVSAGRYEFYYTAEIEQRNQRPERVTRSISFEHNPNWLR